MRLDWLEDILAIEETGSFSGAAERRMLTQSAFSRRIKQIEDYVGVELFDRAHKPIRLNQATQAHKEQIVHLSGALRQLVTDLRRGERMTRNKVVIACQHSLTTALVPSILRRLPIGGDGIYVRLRSANLSECTGLLLSRQADVAIIYKIPEKVAPFGADYLQEMIIGTDRLIPVFNAPLPQDGAAFPCITYPPDVFFGQVLEQRIFPLIGPAQHLPKVETALTLAAVEMATRGIGVAWVPESLVRDLIDSKALVDLSGGLPSCDLWINAMRLHGQPNLAEAAFWNLLQPA